MLAAGLDIGSRSVELVIVESGSDRPVVSRRIETKPTLAADCRVLLEHHRFDRLSVTGYGRALAEVEFGAPSVTEIIAFARGGQALCPGCRTVLDVGGQDTKAIAVNGAGRAVKFEMNDRCAAGAGRFLEMMAAALGCDLADFGPMALSGADAVKLSSMCAVFAESEAVGLLTRGARREDIARSVHKSIIERTAGMLQRVSVAAPVVFAGGAARNECLVKLLEESLGQCVFVPDDPQMVGALGAALLGAESVAD